MVQRNSFIAAFVVCIVLLSGCTPKKNNVDTSHNFNQNWQFVKDVDTTVTKKLFQKENNNLNWQNVSLPHTPNLEPLIIKGRQWQGNCIYRKFFDYPEGAENKQVNIRFGAAMHEANMYLNGEKLTTHVGGYLPFYVDLTPYLIKGENCILVKLNNEDNPHIPPGKPISTLDFNYYGGLYRDVELIIQNNIHITNPIPNGGGIKVSCRNVSSKSAIVRLEAEVENNSAENTKVSPVFIIKDNTEKVIFTFSEDEKKINRGKTARFLKEFTVENPDLWSPENPSLYKCKVELNANNSLVDQKTTNFGIRDIRFEKDGFYLNGKKTKIRGTNRHQEYPYIGYAISKNANYRDAYKIKEAGFNFVRFSHYPQDESFIDACDELGIMVMNAIAGWQFFGDSVFQEACKTDLRHLIWRDQNHPSIILWEASLNESGMTKEFMQEMHQITHDELPLQPVYTCGWIDGVYDVFIPARQHAKPPNYWNDYVGESPLFIAEYGDWEYYAQNAGFNQTRFANLKDDERSSRQLREYGQIRLAQQALNYQEAHNHNLGGAHGGDANWLMYDYNRGYAPDIESSGIMDIFRLPKFAYYFYRSQKKLSTGDTVLFIANYWNNPNYTDVKVYSNCDEVELWLNDSLIVRQFPDSDINSNHLLHPPFTFRNIDFKSGKITARGYINKKLAAVHSRATPGKPAKIELAVDYSHKPIQTNCNDIVFVYAKIIDKDGNFVPDANNMVEFKVEGDVEIIGRNPITAEAGIATALLKAGKTTGEIELSASVIGLEADTLSMNIQDINPEK